MLIPRVFEAINNARVNNAAVTCETLKAAAADHYGKYGKLDYLFGTNGLTIPITNYDTAILMREGLLDKPFSVKIGGGDPSTNCVLQLVAGGLERGGTGYQLDGTANTLTTNAQFVLEAVIFGVSAADAKDLNDRIDGGTLSGVVGAADPKGRVEYGAISSGGSGTVYVYLTHR
jgi:hypothetical protein